MELVSFNTLPMELLQLIVVELSDEAIRALSITCREIYSLLHDLYITPYFWRSRYAHVALHNCVIGKLLPEVITYYGWKKLYYCYTNYVVPVDKPCYVGPTGNLYGKLQSYHQYLITLPVKEVLFLDTKDNHIILLYLDFSGTVSYHIVKYDTVKIGEETFYDLTHITAKILIDVIQYHTDDKFIILLLKSGTVVINDDPGKIRNFGVAVFERNDVTWFDTGLIHYIPLQIVSLTNKNASVRVGVDVVLYKRDIDSHGDGTIIFTWPRYQISE